MSPNDAIDIENLKFAYQADKLVIDIKKIQIRQGELTFIFGPSGSGKSTLLALIGGILSPHSGSINILGTSLHTLAPAKRDKFRGKNIGFIFQIFNLIPYLSVKENIMLPALLQGYNSLSDLEARTRGLSIALGIESILEAKVTDLSVGQQQRVAATRALINSPKLVIADEPTSALDTHHREGFIELLFRVCRESNSTLIFVSHDLALMPLFDRNISLPEINESIS